MRDYTKYYTPPEVIQLMLTWLDYKFGQRLLEPHAGDGRIIKAIRKYDRNVRIDWCETDPNSLLYGPDDTIKIGTFIMDDFLHAHTYKDYDTILANPPFNKDEDIGLHFLKMYYSLKHGGTLVTILPKNFEDFTPLKGLMDLIIEISVHEIIQIPNWAHSTELIMLKLTR